MNSHADARRTRKRISPFGRSLSLPVKLILPVLLVLSLVAWPASEAAAPDPAPSLVSIEVLPAGPTVGVGQTQQFTAVGTYSDGSTRTLPAETGPTEQVAATLSGITCNHFCELAVTPDGQTLYVTGGDGSNKLTVIDVASRTVTQTITLPGGNSTRAIAITPAGSANPKRAYLGRFDGPIDIMDLEPSSPTFRAVVKSITDWGQFFGQPSGGRPDVIAFTPDGSKAYVSNETAPNPVTAINAATETTQAKVNFSSIGFFQVVSGGLAVGPGGSKVYVSHNGNGVGVVDTATNAPVRNIDLSAFVGNSNNRIAVNPSETRAYVADWGSRVIVVDLVNNVAVKSIPIAGAGHWIAMTPDGKRVYVGQSGPSPQLIDTDPQSPTYETVVKTINAGAGYTGIVFSPDGREAYLTSFGGITIIRTHIQLPDSVVWTSDTPAVATINQTGLATAAALGTSTITATSGGISGSTTLTVGEPPPTPAQTPAFGNLSSPAIVYGTAETTLAGNISGAAGVPTGEVEVTLGGVTLAAPVEADGSFSAVFGTATLGAAGSPHTINYHYAGDETYAPASAQGTLTVTRAAARLKIFGGTFAFDGQPHPATGTVAGANGEDLGPPSFAYNGVAAAPSAVGVYAVNATFAGDANHEPASNASVSIYINAGPPAPGGAGTYAVTELGTLGGATSTATAVNASGRVVGYSETAAGETHAFLYDAGVMTDLGTLPGGTFSYATSVNDAGQVVGVSNTAGGQSRAFLYSAGSMTDLGTLGGADSLAYDINNLGQIVGESQTAGGDFHAFLYGAGTMTDLGTLPGGTYSAANALNDAGQLTGYSQTNSGDEHAFLYSAGAMTDLGTLPGDAFSTGSGIDGAGRVVGYSFDPGGATHGFLYDGTVKHDLGVLSDASDFGRALSVSDAGAVVGHSTTDAGDSHGFIFDRTDGLRDLNPLLPAAAGVTVASANGINSGGQIAGAGDDGSGQTRALLLTPVNATTTALASDANPSAYGQTVTFTATVTSAGGTPAGTVQFFDGATSLGTSTLSGGTASVSTSALAVATHTIKATYSGSATFTGSTSPSLSQVVQKADTTTALVSLANPSVYRQPVTFRATVSASAPGSGTAGGAVQFFDGATLLGQVSLSGGVASLTTAALTTGAHNVTAQYRGNANFNVSTSPALAQQVNPSPTVTRLTSSANPSVSGQGVNFRATVSAAPPGGGVPVGSVQFFDGATLLGTRGLTNGSATFGVTNLSVGTHGITARYLGTVNHAASNSGTLSQVVKRASTATAVTGPASSTVGQTVTFTAKVTAVAPGTGVPTGTVQFRINGVNAPGGLKSLSAGSATYTTSSLPVGTSTVTAVYNGSTNFNTSSGSLIHRRR